MGNRKAAERLLKQLQIVGSRRYCIKLDVKKYFESIPHEKLFTKLMAVLPDQSLHTLLQSLIASHTSYHIRKRGIPIGNLTSQLFANFYLRELDLLICENLGISHTQDHGAEPCFYIRYMDDMVIVANNKKRAIEAAKAALDFVHLELELEIPSYKVMVLAKDPIPFLGFVHSEHGYRPLRRNELKFVKKMKRLNKKGAELSLKAQMIQSFEAWQKLEV
ncbi:MAG: RNA-directed DNA polymerase, partial [Bdellovibrionales bacterium]|nr:RNA-directed DNA polymerase [Bdellovibrionales bacterium]